MRRLLILTTILAAATALVLPATAHAVVKTCSVSSAGGEKVPQITNATGQVIETGSQGYHCTVPWDAAVQPMYEAGGTWHFCVTDTFNDECPPGFHPDTPDQFWPAGSDYNWPHTSGGHVVDGWWVFTIDLGNTAPDLPVCSVNWRFQVAFFDATHFVFLNDTSPALHKTC